MLTSSGTKFIEMCSYAAGGLVTLRVIKQTNPLGTERTNDLAAGFSEQELLRSAGVIQIMQNVKRFVLAVGTGRQFHWSGSGFPFFGPPYGDQLNDQEQIHAGFRYYKAWKAGCR